MGASKYNKRIEIQQPSSARDTTSNELVPTWPKWNDRWAGIIPLTGTELLQAKQINSEVQSRIEIRYIAGLQADMRIKYGSRYFEILWFTNIKEQNKEIHIFAKEDLG